MARTVLEVVVAADPRSLERGLSRSGKAVDKFGRQADKSATRASVSIGKIGTTAKAVGGVIAGAGVVSGLRSIVDAASAVGEASSKNRVLFGRFAKDIQAFSKTSAKSFGISRAAALDFAGSFGQFFRQAGKGQRDAARLGVTFTKLSADLASFNNTSIQEAADALKSGLAGEAEPLRRFGVLLNDAQLRNEALRQGLVRTTKDALTPQQKTLATYGLVMQQTSKAQGDFARTSGGVANQSRIAQAHLENLKAAIGQKLVPAVTQAVTAFNKLLASGVAGDAFQRVRSVIDPVVGSITRVVRGFRDGETASVTLVAALAAVTAGFVALKIITTVAKALVAAKAAMLALNVALAANPIGLVVAALVGLGAGLVVAYKKSETFRRVVDGAFDAVKDASRAAISAILTGIDKWLGAYSSLFRVAARLPVVGGKFRGIADAIDGARENVRGLKDEINGVKSKNVVIGVKLRVTGNGISGTVDESDLLTPTPQEPRGDGFGVARAVRGAIRGAAVKAAPSLVSPTGPVGSLMGANRALAPIAAVGAGAGTRVSSGLRPGAITSSGNPSYHGTGEAVDLVGTPAAMLRTFRAIKARFGSRLAELIYTPGGVGIRNGRPHRYTGRVAADHHDHVHAALDIGRPGAGVGDGPGRYSKARLASVWQQAGGLSSSADVASAVALAESGGNPGASNRNRDGSIDRGLWQINSVHGRLSTFDVAKNAAAAVRISKRGRDWSPWVAFKNGAYRRFLGGLKGGSRDTKGRKGPLMSGGLSGVTGLLREPSEAERRREEAAQAARDYAASNSGGGGFSDPPTPDPERPPTALEKIGSVLAGPLAQNDADLALAALTPDTADDRQALLGRKGWIEAGLISAKESGDPEAIAFYARELKGVLDQLGDIDAQRQAEAERQQRIIDLTQEIVDVEKRKLRFLETQSPAVVAALGAVISGDIGGRVGLGVVTPGWPGGRGVRYAPCKL